MTGDSKMSKLASKAPVIAVVRGFVLILLLAAVCLPAFAFDEDHRAPINGTTLHFRVRGANKANPYLLILHGGPGVSAHMFYTWGASLEHNVNVVYLDQRGCGQSAHLSITSTAASTDDAVKDYTIANLVKDIEGVREFLKLDRWFVLGHAWGAMLGVEYAVSHPERVSGFVVMDGLISQPRSQDSIIDALQAHYEKQRESSDRTKKSEANSKLYTIQELRQTPASLGRMNLVSEMAGLLFADLYFAHPSNAAAIEQAMVNACKQYRVPEPDLFAGEPIVALQTTERYASKDDTSLLKSITSPTMIINGRQDVVIPPVSAQIIKSGIKGSQLVLLDDCGHYPFIEQPARAASAILDFVNQHPH